MFKVNKNEETRHGDISFHRLDSIPANFNPVKHSGSFVLAEGEATGHHHKISVKEKNNDFQIFKDEDNNYILKVNSPCQLTHQEHKTIEFTKGIYFVKHETEYNPFTEELEKIKD